MKITKTDLENALKRIDPLNRSISGIEKNVAKHGWPKVIRNVGDLRTAFLDNHIDLLSAGLSADEPVEIIDIEE